MQKKKKKAIATGTVVALLGAGAAYAYWTTSGSGEGSGDTTAGVVEPARLHQDSLNAMYPGDSPQDLGVTVTNNATESAYVNTVKAYITTDKGAGCDGSNFLLDGTAAPSTAADAVALTWTAQDLAEPTARTTRPAPSSSTTRA